MQEGTNLKYVFTYVMFESGNLGLKRFSLQVRNFFQGEKYLTDEEVDVQLIGPLLFVSGFSVVICDL